MENAPRRNTESTLYSERNQSIDHSGVLSQKIDYPIFQRRSSDCSTAGNEENAPENSIENSIGDDNTSNSSKSNSQQQQPRFIKKMRMGATPLRDGNSRRLSSSDWSTAGSSAGGVMTLEPSTNDTAMYASSTNKQISILPTLQKTSSSDAGTDSSTASSISSRNWLDDYGKQIKGNFNKQSNATKQLRAPDKDPRFHYKRQIQQSCDDGTIVSAPSDEKTLFPEDSMEDSQVVLAPVMRRSGAVSSPWKGAPRQPSHNQSFASPAFRKRSSVVETSQAAFATSQETPELATSFSQDTIASSSHSAATSSFTSSTTSSMASALVKRIVDKSATSTTSTAPSSATKARVPRQTIRGTPVRIKPRVKPQDVQATDQGYASVAKLSAWLADDPTSSKKVRHVRRGANVIAKSRKFEKDLEEVIVEENNIATGEVKNKANWLKSAFSHDAEDHEGVNDSFHHDPNRHLMLMRTQPVNMDDDCARSEFVVSNDAASSISVSNKKKWLENAFKKEGSEEPRMSFKARSDIGPLQDSRDDVTSRAKKMWQQKSESRGNARKPPSPSPYRHHQNRLPPPSNAATPSKVMSDKTRLALTFRTSAPPACMAEAASTLAAAATPPNHQGRHSVSGSNVQVEKDTTSVDFKAARQLLIQRSKQNGNEVKVASKVQRRAGKFERINKDNKRRTSAMGLLKPTWESNSVAGSEVSEGGSSTAYTKCYVEDIAPKKSLEDFL